MLKGNELMEEAIGQMDNHDSGDDTENDLSFRTGSAVLASPPPPYSDVANSVGCLEAMAAECYMHHISFHV